MKNNAQQVSSEKSGRIAAGLIVVAVAVAFGPVLTASSVDRISWRAATALWQQDFPEAQELAEQLLQANATSDFALVIAGDAAAGLHQSDLAIQHYQQVDQDAGDLAYRAQFGLSERFQRLGKMMEAERHLRYVLDRNPNEFEANKQFAFLMQVQGRTWEAVAPGMRMIRQGIFGAVELHIVGCPENRFLADERFLATCKLAAPEDPRCILAEARLAELRNQSVEAEVIYRKVIAADSGLIEASIRLGRILLDQDRHDEFLQIMKSLPLAAESHGGFWLNRAVWADKAGDSEGAGRCLLETLNLAPGNVEANYMLSQVLVKLRKPNAARQFGDRAKILARIELTMPEFYDSPSSVELMQTLANDFESINRIWEAAAVCHFAINVAPESRAWSTKQLAALSDKLKTSGGTLISAAPMDAVMEMFSYQLPNWDRIVQRVPELQPRQTSSASAVTFNDVASGTGLNFTFFNGSVSVRGMEHIFETTGGGVSALDYDGDLWPDVYFSQGAPIWEGDDNVKRIDCLFRNTGNGFRDATAAAGLGDDRFSQGANVGDFDNDGFADLYVGNLTGNRFYRNNGDGTFSEVTDETNTGGDEWTVSCMLADLNGDSLQDLYVVNYLERESVFERRCRQNGEPLTCAPTMFPAEQDRVYLNLGDGGFREVTQECGVVQAEGKGLAILAGDIDDYGRLSVFVGNDTAPNFFFQNSTSTDKRIQFEEAGTISGLAVDGMGRSQATMGVACGDVDGSGTMDLFITNFYEDANTLYLHHGASTFLDSTRDVGLYEPSIPMLGFGTEFLDADLDGNLDLFVTNGHVDRTNATGEPDEMPPQFFRNHGGAKFTQQVDPTPGEYFSGKYLGRTVSRLDWNRDGLDDLCVLHLYSPVAMLENTTAARGGSLTIRLRGTTTDRDALGTVVNVTTSKGTSTHQLTAGDGYMTTNERLLNIGLGDADRVLRIAVRWPNGKNQVFDDVSSEQEILIIEDRKHPLNIFK